MIEVYLILLVTAGWRIYRFLKDWIRSVMNTDIMKNVFLFPFWSEIYSNDNERKQDKELAEATADMMERIYSELGYRIIRVPLVSPEERVEWIKETISNLDMS